jgi:hypothetical protein
MPQPHPLCRALAVFACALVLLASADDFNLVRTVLPLAAPAPEVPLPLDDPNSDFTEGSRVHEQTPPGRDPCEGPAAVGRDSVRTAVAPPARGHSTRNPITSPLRC